jgi:hypothetical protein
MPAKPKLKPVPKHQQQRRKLRIYLTLDPGSLAELERIREAEGLDSLSQTVRWLVRQPREMKGDVR